MEKRIVLPGYIFVAGTNMLVKRRCDASLIPCEVPYLKEMCQNDALIGISRGIIRNGITIVTSGPLKGRESLIRKIDRHKRIADIAIPFDGGRKRITVGLEIYEKEI